MKIYEQELPFPKGAFRKESLQDFDKVLVAISLSAIPQAGLGLYLLSGPVEDGSAPTDNTRVPRMMGLTFTQEQYLIRSDKYQSDYVWEGINLFTGETVMVDGSPLCNYGPYMNDGLAFKESNTTMVFGNDGKMYVETSTKNVELLLFYGNQYWLEPLHWELLSESTKNSILQYYKCKPPQVSRTPGAAAINESSTISLPPTFIISSSVQHLDVRFTR